MTSLLDGFTENTNIFRGDLNKIDQQAFEALVEEHGLSVAIGYMKCLHEMTEVIGNIMVVLKYNEYYLSEKPHIVFNKMSNLHIALYNFVQNNNLDTSSLLPAQETSTRLKIF